MKALLGWLPFSGKSIRAKQGGQHDGKATHHHVLEKKTAELLALISKWAATRKLCAYVIGLPICEKHTGVSLETSLCLKYELNGIPTWGKYVYTEDESQEDQGSPSVHVNIMSDDNPLTETDKKEWSDFVCCVRSILPETVFCLM